MTRSKSVIGSKPGRRRRVKVACWQEHELWYIVDRLREMHTDPPHYVVWLAVQHCQTEVQRREGLETLLQRAHHKLKHERATV